MKKKMLLPSLALAILFSVISSMSHAEDKKVSETKCELHFTIKSWAIFYKKGKGQGKITCDNGQSAKVKINTEGGGLTFGTEKITDGYGNFSKVESINELFGSYATSEANAAVVDAGGVKAMTKGNVSLALSGTGKGMNIGLSFGAFKIARVR